MTSILFLVERHFEEAVFLWRQRSAAVHAPHFDLRALADLDERLEAHLDGLRVAGESGWDIARQALGGKGPGEVFVAAALAFESGDETRIDFVLDSPLEHAEGIPGIISALGWLPREQAHRHIQVLLASSTPMLRQVGIAAAAIRRSDPGPALLHVLHDSDLLLKARSLRAVGELGRVDLITLAMPSLASSNEQVRFASAWSVALLSGDGQALAVLQSIAESAVGCRYKALEMTLRRTTLSAAKVMQKRLAENPAYVRIAVIAAGAIGDCDVIPWLIESMKVLPLSRVAGEAFAMITGVDIANEHLDLKQPEGFESGPNDNPKDGNVAPDEDDRLPWPDPVLIQEWWQRNQIQFQNDTRYLLGKPITVEWLQQVLRIGRQRQRAAAALELAIRQPGQPLFNVVAPGFRQAAMLGLK